MVSDALRTAVAAARRERNAADQDVDLAALNAGHRP